MIIDIQGAANELVTKTVPMSTRLSRNHYVRLNYFHLPDLPLIDEEKDAFEVASSGVQVSVPRVGSIQELVNVLDGFEHQGDRVFYAWYNDHELELCTGVNAVTLSATFAAVIKMPLVLAASTCYSASLYEKHVSTYSHFAVRVNSAQGEWDGDGYNEFIAKVLRDGTRNKISRHYFHRSVSEVRVDVFTVKKDGTIEPYISPDVWSLGLELEEEIA